MLKKRGPGRPGRGAEPAQVVAVRLTVDELSALDRLAAQKHLTRSELDRQVPFRVGFITSPEREATCENAPLALVRRVDQRFRRRKREMRGVLTGSNSERRSLKLVTEFYETLPSWDWYLDAGTLQRR